MEKKPQDTPSRHADKYVLRLPEGLRERVAKASEEAGRSMNAEFVKRLEESFQRQDPDLVDPVKVQNILNANTRLHTMVERLNTTVERLMRGALSRERMGLGSANPEIIKYLMDSYFEKPILPVYRNPQKIRSAKVKRTSLKKPRRTKGTD